MTLLPVPGSPTMTHRPPCWQWTRSVSSTSWAPLPRQNLAERRLDQGQIVGALAALVRDVTSVGIFVGLRLEGGL
jgi:hypothetical protein